MLLAIVFDFDGVIADSEPLHYRALLRVTQPLGCAFTYDDYLRRYVGFDDRDAFRAILADHRRPEARDPALLTRLVRAKGDAFEAVVQQGVTTFEGTVEFVRAAAAALPLAIASGATRRDIDLVLGRLGLAETFEPIITADMVQRSKPDPETYRLAVEGLRRRAGGGALAPSHCLAIEDTAAGIDAARAAGLWTLGLSTTTDGQGLARAHRVLPSVRGLTVAQLQEWFG